MSKYSLGSAAILIGLVMGAGTALANETFIPSGHSYTPESSSLPPLNSYQDRVTNQTDIYQSEIWHKQYEQRQFDSDMRRLLNRDMRPGPSTKPIY